MNCMKPAVHLNEAATAPLLSLCLLCCLLLCSGCKDGASYAVMSDGGRNSRMELLEWDVCVVSPPDADSAAVSADGGDTLRQLGTYTPKYGQLDLKEVFGVAYNDTTHALEGMRVRLSCLVRPECDTTVYAEVSSAMPYTLTLNGDTLVRRDIQGLNIHPVRLSAEGDNRLEAELEVMGDNHSFEVALCDSFRIAAMYAGGQSCNIIYPLIHADSRTVMLTNAHQNVLDTPVRLELHDVYGRRIADFMLEKGAFTYPVPELEKDRSYMCSMTLCGVTVRQPVLCGGDDDAFARFSAMRDSLPDGSPRADEIDQLLYRLGFLLNHPTRYEGDWWWQFKISPLTYQLEHAFARPEGGYAEDGTEANIRFVTYRSEQDDSLQRYILARPNRIDTGSPLPLVVVIRPNIENMHHFFSCPQLARQWAVNQMQDMSQRYGFLVMMPEMRTYLDEDLTPEAEKELKLAIEDVCRHYPVNRSHIFLHANCSGGYRALRVATENPDMFAAIGLYAPLYHRRFASQWSEEHAPERSISRLAGVPMMIHGDPIDVHSPYILYKDLVDDCRRYDIPLTLSLKRNSGKYYNVVLVGEEAFEFFKKQVAEEND